LHYFVQCACFNFSESRNTSTVEGVLFPEFILDIPDDSSVYSSDDDERTEGLANVLNCEKNSTFSVEELERSAADSAKHDDKLFDEFKKAIKRHPKQVLLHYCLMCDNYYHIMSA